MLAQVNAEVGNTIQGDAMSDERRRGLSQRPKVMCLQCAFVRGSGGEQHAIGVKEDNDENQDEEQVEESSDSDDTRDHDYLINQTQSRNKGDSKLEKASELSPGHLARVMSSRKGRDRVREQEAKSRNASEKSYKTQSNGC